MSEKARRIEDIALIIIFIPMIALPLVNFVLPVDPSPRMKENRRLVTDPGFESVITYIYFPTRFLLKTELAGDV